jgi:iron complex outermembrane receptor protein
VVDHGGLRYTDESKTADVLNQLLRDATFTTPMATPSDFTDSVDFKNLSPKVSLDWQIDDDTLVYGLIAAASRAAASTSAPRSAVPASACRSTTNR